MKEQDRKPRMTQYAVWRGSVVSPHWQLYNTLEDAVSDSGDGVVVYRLDAVKVGAFQRAVKLMKERK